MVADQFIAARVSRETKARLKATAERCQLSESAWLKRLLEVTLDAGTEPQIGSSPEARRVLRAARLYVRLRPDDQLLLTERATARGMAAATYVSVLVRAHLQQLTPIPKGELLAFKCAVAELGAIGRNLNQIARELQQHADISVSGPRTQDLTTMLKICCGLRDHFKATLLANLRSWQVGNDTEAFDR